MHSQHSRGPDPITRRAPRPQVMASQKQLEKKATAARDTANEWYRRAQLALEKGDEELAREALKRKRGFEENATQLESQLAAQKQATEQLIANARTLENKLAEAKSKKDTLKARAASAKTSKQIVEMVGQLDSSNAVVGEARGDLALPPWREEPCPSNSSALPSPLSS